MGDASKYHLRVTAGPSYDLSTHHLLHINTPQPQRLTTPKISTTINVRIKNFRGLPLHSPNTSPYFTSVPHQHDLYSIAFSFSLPPDSTPIPGTDLVFGNDFANSISKNLPPGFSSALRIVKWAIDPGLDGDVYADRPYLYGPLLSSINVLRVEGVDGAVAKEAGKDGELKQDAGFKEPSTDSAKEEDVEEAAWEEGGFGKGEELRKAKDVPATGAARMKHFLNEAAKKDWVFEPGYEYKCDFFNPYLDFNEFSLKLPGFSLAIMKYWDGQPLRYVLKHKTADGSIDEPLFVIQFTLIPNDEVEEEEKKWLGAADAAKAENTDRTDKDDSKAAPEDGKAEQPEASPAQYVDEGVD